MKTRTVKGVKIEADDLVVGLIDRLIKTENALASIRSELNDHMEMIAEQQPKLDADGNVTVLAMRSIGDSAEQVTVKLITPTLIGESV